MVLVANLLVGNGKAFLQMALATDNKKRRESAYLLALARVRCEEKDETEEASWLTKVSVQIKPHAANVAVTEEVWRGQTSSA